ncbi:MAG: hypothetical protein ABIH34_08235 [Nanoarchaeota archaeon]
MALVTGGDDSTPLDDDPSGLTELIKRNPYRTATLAIAFLSLYVGIFLYGKKYEDQHHIGYEENVVVNSLEPVIDRTQGPMPQEFLLAIEGSNRVFTISPDLLHCELLYEDHFPDGVSLPSVISKGDTLNILVLLGMF